MELRDVPVPEIYESSADFRFFRDWFTECLNKLKYDTENIFDLYDPQRCPKELLWLLGETMGYKYDDRVLPAMNRLVLLYFMSMIYLRGSKNGMTLAAEVNLAQFNLNLYAQDNDALRDRLEDTTIPVNSVYVTPHVAAGYIDVVYYSEVEPVDVCMEYVRPLGMYCFHHSGVRVDARSKITVDARLTNSNNIGMSVGPTHVGHYRRRDYAMIQRTLETDGSLERRDPVYYRNSDYEKVTDPMIDPYYRTLYSLQICNNEHIMQALFPSIPDPIFSLGKATKDLVTEYPDNYLKNADKPEYNLRYDRDLEESMGIVPGSPDVWTMDDRDESAGPVVNPPMQCVNDAMVMDPNNTTYTEATPPDGLPVNIINV